jgi:hypothetical protein
MTGRPFSLVNSFIVFFNFQKAVHFFVELPSSSYSLPSSSYSSQSSSSSSSSKSSSSSANSSSSSSSSLHVMQYSSTSIANSGFSTFNLFQFWLDLMSSPCLLITSLAASTIFLDEIIRLDNKDSKASSQDYSEIMECSQHFTKPRRLYLSAAKSRSMSPSFLSILLP